MLGIGPVLAHRICEPSKLDTIEALEMAVHDRRLGEVPALAIGVLLWCGTALAEMLARARRVPPPSGQRTVVTETRGEAAGGSSKDATRSAYGIALRVEPRLGRRDQTLRKACLILANNLAGYWLVKESEHAQ
jgi:hypothetical protein